jgi:hypothetical protein
MKRLSELKPHDLETVAVWRYEGEGDDAAVVRATEKAELSESDRESFIARTQFVLADGTQHIGFCSPSDDSGLDYIQPVIVTVDGPVFFWFDAPPTAEFLAAQFARLGVDHGDIFPVHFRCTVPVDGRLISGVVTDDDITGAA